MEDVVMQQPSPTPIPEGEQSVTMQVVPSAPTLLDQVQETTAKSVDDYLLDNTPKKDTSNVPIQNPNEMALALEAAFEGKITYQQALKDMMADGGFSSQSVRNHAAALYAKDIKEARFDFDKAASMGMLEQAEAAARTIDAYINASASMTKEKAITKITKDAATNLATSNLATIENNTPDKLYQVSKDIGSTVGISELVDQYLVKKGVQPSKEIMLGTLGAVLGGPIALTLKFPVAGLLSGVGVSALFNYNNYLVTDAIESISGIPKKFMQSADQINNWRNWLSTLSPQEALDNFVAVADYIIKNQKLPGEVGKVFSVFNLMKLADAYDETEWAKMSLSLKTQDLLDQVGLGFDAAGILQTVRKGFTSTSIAAKTIGGAKTGELVGKEIVENTTKLGLGKTEQTGYSLSMDLNQYLPDGITGLSSSVQKEIHESLTKTLATLEERLSIAEDASTLALRDFVLKNAEKYNSNVVSTNLQTGEMVLQHMGGKPFYSKENAIAFAKKVEEQTGLKFEVVPANEGVTHKFSTFEYPDVGNERLVSYFEDAKEGLFHTPEGIPYSGSKTVSNMLEAVSDSKEMSPFERALSDFFAKNPSFEGVKVGIIEKLDDWKRIPGFDPKMETSGLYGKYNWRDNTLYLFDELKTSPRLVLHETMHAAISQVVDTVLGNVKTAVKAARITDIQKAAVKNIDEIFKDAKFVVSRGIDEGIFSISDSAHYGFSNVHEFISEGMSNPAFQDLLKRITLSEDTVTTLKETNKTFLGTVKTAWDVFTKLLAKTLGIKRVDDNAMSQFLENTARLLQNTDFGQQNLVGAFKRSGMSAEEIKGILDGTSMEARALSHGWYVKHAGNALLHTKGDIDSRFGGLLKDPVHSASELSVHERTIVLHQEQKDRNALRKFMEDGFKGVTRKENKRIVKVLEDGDELGRDFSVVELEARGLKSDREKRAYYTYRTLSNVDLAIKNNTLKENLMRRGFMQGYIKDGLITHYAPSKIVPIAEEEGRNAYNLLTKRMERIDSTKHSGNNIVRTAKPVVIGGQEYTLLIGDNATVSFGRLRNQIPNRPGSFRHYYTQDFFGNVSIKRTVNGEVVDDVLHLRTSNSGKDIEKWAAAMTGLLKQHKANPGSLTPSIIEKAVGKWEDPTAIYNSIANGEWDNYTSFGHHYDRASDAYLDTLAKAQWDDDLAKTTQRGMRLTSIDTNKDNILDPISAIQAEITNVSRHRNIDAWRDKWVQTWWNTFSETLPDALKNSNRSPLSIMSDPSLQLSMYTKGDTLGKFAEDQRKYILTQLGVKTLDERTIESALKRFTHQWSSESKFAGIEVGDKLITAGHALRNADPLQFIRSFNFFTMLSAFNPAQLIVQSAGALNAIAVSPVHGLKAAYSVPLLRVALASDNPAVWSKLATIETFAKLGVSSQQEFVDVVRAIRKTGIIEGVVGTSMHSAETGRFNMFTGMMNKLGEKSAFFFNRGEEFSKLTAFEVARREFIAANPNVAWNSDASLRAIVTRTDDLTQNMTRSNLAYYQRGVASIPGQFLQYNLKLANNLIGAGASWAKGVPYRGYTIGEASSILAGHIVAYGLAGNGLMMMADELTGGYEKLVGRSMTDDEKLAFSQGAIAALINEVSQLTTGTDTKLAVGSRLGVFEWYDKIAKAAMRGDSSFWEVVLGPSYGSATRLGALKALVEPMVRKDMSVEAFGEAFNTVGKEVFSGWKSASKAMYAQMHDGQVVDKQGTPIATITKGEIIAQAIGVGSAAEQDYWRLQIGFGERKKAVAEFAKAYLDAEKVRLEVLKNDGENSRYKALTDFMISLHNPLPSGERDLFWSLVDKPTGIYATAPYKDKITKLRAEILDGTWNMKDVINTNSGALTEHKPLEAK